MRRVSVHREDWRHCARRGNPDNQPFGDVRVSCANHGISARRCDGPVARATAGSCSACRFAAGLLEVATWRAGAGKTKVPWCFPTMGENNNPNREVPRAAPSNFQPKLVPVLTEAG